MVSALYDRLAPIYDQWLSGDDAAEPCLQFYLAALADVSGRVLELGAGTGRICRALASAGATVVGMDESALMLEQARAVPHAPDEGTPWLVRARFEALPFADGVFAAILLPMRTLGHLTEPAMVHALFASAHRVLEPGGRFLLDHYNIDRDWARAHDGTFRLMYAGPVIDRDDRAVLIWDKYTYNFADQYLECVVRIDEVGPLLANATGREVSFQFRWFEVDEVTAHARDAGFQLETCSGDFSGTPYREDSDHMVFTFRKQ
jgi:SAM-dependent methyltransferase